MSEDSKISSMDTTFQSEVERQLSQVPEEATIYTRLLSGEPEATLVFLDFDGVLLPRQAPGGVLDEICRKHFEETMRECPEVKIVAASGWRLDMSLNEIQNLFSPDIAARVVGMTPIIETLGPYARYREVLAYITKLPMRVAWVALDGNPDHYPEPAIDCNVLLTNPDVGVDEEIAAKLSHLLSHYGDNHQQRVTRFLCEYGGLDLLPGNDV